MVALRWCSLFTMFISTSILAGKYGALCSTPTTSTGLPPMRSVLPTTLLSPPKCFSQ